MQFRSCPSETHRATWRPRSLVVTRALPMQSTHASAPWRAGPRRRLQSCGELVEERSLGCGECLAGLRGRRVVEGAELAVLRVLVWCGADGFDLLAERVGDRGIADHLTDEVL